jgi:hypothetical protein
MAKPFAQRQRRGQQAAGRGRESADQGGRSDQVGLLGRQAGDAPHVKAEHGSEHGHVDQAQVALEGQHERIKGRRQQHGQLQAVALLELDVAAAEAEIGQGDHQRPGDADEQPVRPGHIGDGVAGVGRVLGGEPGEAGIDHVLGQDGDQRQQGECEALREVELDRLGRPRQQEGGPHDGDPVDERPHRIGRAEGPQLKRNPRRGRQGRGGDPRPPVGRLRPGGGCGSGHRRLSPGDSTQDLATAQPLACPVLQASCPAAS